MEVLQRFRNDFVDLVNVFMLRSRDIPFTTNQQYLQVLYNSLIIKENQLLIERDDVEQELAMLWLLYARKYMESKPDIHIRQYLRRLSVWGLRQYFNRVTRPVTHAPLMVPEEEITDHGFKLDLQFLLKGTDFHPLSVLTPYERYLIFLKFKEEKTILEIAYIVQKTKKTVCVHLQKTIKKLRSQLCQPETSKN